MCLFKSKQQLSFIRAVYKYIDFYNKVKSYHSTAAALWCQTCLMRRGSLRLTCLSQDLCPLSSDQLDSCSSQRISGSIKEHKNFHSPYLRIVIHCLQTFLQQALQPQRNMSYFRHHCHEKVMTEHSEGCRDLSLCSSGVLRGSEEHWLWE